MAGRAAVERIGADAIARSEFGGLDRLVGRNGDRAVGEIVELLPAGEQRLERRVGLRRGIERTALGQLTALREGVTELGNRFRIDLLAGDHRCEDLLALLDLLDASSVAAARRAISEETAAGAAVSEEGATNKAESGVSGPQSNSSIAQTSPFAPVPKGAVGEDDCRRGQTGPASGKSWSSQLPLGSWLRPTPQVTGAWRNNRARCSSSSVMELPSPAIPTGDCPRLVEG